MNVNLIKKSYTDKVGKKWYNFYIVFNGVEYQIKPVSGETKEGIKYSNYKYLCVLATDYNNIDNDF